MDDAGRYDCPGLRSGEWRVYREACVVWRARVQSVRQRSSDFDCPGVKVIPLSSS